MNRGDLSLTIGIIFVYSRCFQARMGITTYTNLDAIKPCNQPNFHNKVVK